MSELVTGFASLRRRGAASSRKVQACLWNWHITHEAESGLMTQRLLRRRQASQGRSGRMMVGLGLGPSPTPTPTPGRALGGDVMPGTVPGGAPGGLLDTVVGSAKGRGMVESMVIMGVF